MPAIPVPAPSGWRRRAARYLAALAILFGLGWPGAARAGFTRFQSLDEEQGLGNVTVAAIGQDPDGYVLLGTESGLYCFDGVSVIRYPAAAALPEDAWVRGIATDPVARLWVLTADGLFARFPGEAGLHPVPLGFAPDLREAHRFAASADALVASDRDGRLWRMPVAAHGLGVPAPLLSDAAVARFPVLRAPRFVSVDPEGGWLVGAGATLFRVRDGQVVDLGAGLPPDRWEIARRDGGGTLWARSLTRIAARPRTADRFDSSAIPGPEDAFSARQPQRIELLPDGRGGVVTQHGDGLLDWNGHDWTPYRPHEGGLSSSPVQSLFFDRENSLWVGTMGRGAFRSLGLGVWEHDTAADGLPSDLVWSITRAATGALWVATFGDTAALDGSGFRLPGNSENVAASTGGRIWTAPFEGGLSRLDRDRTRSDVVAFPHQVLSMSADAADRLWVAAPDGLWLLSDADAPAASIRPERVLSGAAIAVFADPAGTIWAAMADGIHRRGPSGRFSRVLSAAAIGGRPALATFAAPDELWVLPDPGSELKRFRLSPDGPRELSPVAPPVIASANVQFLHRDRRGIVWVGTDRGLDRFDGVSWRHIDHRDGPISDDMDQYAVSEDGDGTLWFGTSRGLSHLLRPDIRPGNGTLHPLVTALSLGGRAIPPARLVRYDWTSAPLSIRFADLDFTGTSQIVFRYRMRGIDANWNTTAGRDVRYAALPAGRFIFELMAVDPVRGRMSAPVSIDLAIRAPWWRRPVFVVPAVLAGVGLLSGLVAAVWRLRMRWLLRRQHRLEAMVRERTAEIERAQEQLQLLAMTDPLTGLPNRRSIMERFERDMAAGAPDAPFAVLLLDIDHFKKINDHFGHLAGDAVLEAFGARLGSCLAPDEMAARYGGEEFCVVLPGARPAVEARLALLRSAITDATYNVAGRREIVTASGGLAFRCAGDSSLSLIARADAALYEAKSRGRNRIEFERAEDGIAPEPARTGVDPDRAWERADRRRRLEADLGAALIRDEFLLHYQPVIDIERNEVVSFEALLRWESPRRGLVPPASFIPFAEEIGLMPAIGDWVLRRACRDAAAWPASIGVSVNLSPAQFRLPDLVRRVSDALADTGLDPSRLELELTETAIVDSTETVRAMLSALRALGLPIALDDFGTGYSSLSFLRTLPFDRVKIDRSFVQDLGENGNATAIVSALIGMCQRMDLAVTAEGVETDSQVAALQALGCRDLQGYRLGRPTPRSGLGRWLDAARDAHGQAAVPMLVAS